MNEYKRKGVVFNLTDPDQRKLYNHAMKRTNFSAYVKRLIQKDLEGYSAGKGIQETTVTEIQEDIITDVEGFL